MNKFLLVAVIIALPLSACDKQEPPKTANPSKQSQTPAVSPVTAEAGSASSNVPVQLQVVGHYNIVKFKDAFYACPHGQEVNWEKDDVAKLSGVLVADTQDHLIAKLPR